MRSEVDEFSLLMPLNDLPVISINEKALCYVDNYCYLGVKLDGKLNFKNHYSSLVTAFQHNILLQ